MNRRQAFRALSALLIAGGAVLTLPSAAFGRKKAGDAAYTKCGQVCSSCAGACRACEKHCVAMIKGGMKEHDKTRRLCEDSADICALAAQICKRHGPTTAEICEACAKACDVCSAECLKYPAMKPMKDCATACIACAKACRDLIKQL